MKKHSLKKLLSGVGLVAMLLGTLMVLTPTGAGAATVSADCPDGSVASAKWETQNNDQLTAVSATETAGEGFEGATASWDMAPDNDDDGQPPSANQTYVEWFGTTVDVDWIHIKQGNQPDQTVAPDDGSAPDGHHLYLLDDDISHFTLCSDGQDEPEDGTLEIVKVVDGDEAAIPATWSFEFSDDLDEDLTDVDFTLTNGAPSHDFGSVSSDAITITELSAGDAASTSISCSGVEDESVDGLSVTVSVPAETAVVCTFTNTFQDDTPPPGPTPTPTPTPEPEQAVLTIVKVVDGNDVPSTWSFDFSGDVNTTLTDGNPNDAFALDAGTYTVSEDDISNLTSIECNDDDSTGTISDGTVTAVLDAGESVTCTFTNTFVTDVVLDEEVVAEQETPTTTTTIVVENQEVTPQVTTLPRTGNETRNLAGIGAALLVFGAVLVGGSRRFGVNTL